MYQKYNTEALVLGSYEVGESDKTIVLYTRDFGLVRARASAVRSEYSRMRYAAQHFSRSHVSLVRGKRGWRLAGATALSLPRTGAGLSSFARIAELTTRLVGTDEKNEYLYDALTEAHTALMSAQGGSALGRPVSDVSGVIEIVCVARLLYSLGYISNEALQSALFTHTAYTGESLMEAETMRDKLLSSINRAIAETHL